MIDYQRPPEKFLKRRFNQLKFWEWYTQPSFFGLENVPSQGPVLYVANHTLTVMIDTPLISKELYTQKDIFLWTLGDHIWYKYEFQQKLGAFMGGVQGTREILEQLFSKQFHVLVYPGGSYETFKKKEEKNIRT